MSGISIIVPTLNEAEAPRIIGQIYATFGKDVEVIVIDKSNARMKKELLATGANVITQKSAGYENALMEGFRLAKNDILATIDADGTYSVEDLKRAINELQKGEYSFVSGSRAQSFDGNVSRHIKFGNNFLTKLFNILYRRKMTDVLSGIFALTKQAFDAIKDDEPYRAGTIFFEIELVRRGFSITDIPIGYAERKASKSKISRAKPFYGITMAFHAIRYARDYNPLLIFGSIGVTAILVGIIIGVLVISNFLATGTLTEIGRALISFMLIIGGFLSIIAGLILDLLLEIERKLYKKNR